jgi:methyl-accepting chemotaxis protein
MEGDMSDSSAVYNSVRNLYDQYRTASLNRKYYGCRLQAIRGWNNFFEIAIAIGTSSVVGGWSLWHTGVGSTIWTILGGVTALLAIVKPFLQLSKQVERYTKLFIGYGDAFYDFELLVNEIGRIRRYNDEIDAAFRKTIDRLKQLAADDDPQPNHKLVKDCTGEVNREIPPDRLWWPEK